MADTKSKSFKIFGQIQGGLRRDKERRTRQMVGIKFLKSLEIPGEVKGNLFLAVTGETHVKAFQLFLFLS